MQDLENPDLFENAKTFAGNMRAMREHIAQSEKLRHPYQKGRSFLDAAALIATP